MIERDGERLTIGVTIRIPVLDKHWGRWQLLGWPWHWERGRGGWPSRWRDLPPVDGVTAPIYHWWCLGPFELRRYRFNP